MPLSSSCLLLWACLFLPAFAASQGLVQTGRYTVVTPVATAAQKQPLQQVLTLKFPDEVATVGAAAQHLLQGTGYALSDVLHWDPEVLDLFDRPLPETQRELGPLSVLSALETLVGPAFRVVIDPVHRLVRVELDPHARALGFGDSVEHDEEGE